MHTLRTLAAATLLLTAPVGLAACSNDDPTTTENGGGSTSGAEFNDADVSFAQDMIPHHQQAVRMAQMAADRADSEEVRQLAADIEAAQAPEIEQMTAWLEAWGEDVPDDMSGMEGMEGMDMPGMMSEDQMQEMESASGAAFDQMFLESMVEHHEGAIEMAQTEQAEGENPDAVALAEKIETDQQAEIQTIEQLLAGM